MNRTFSPLISPWYWLLIATTSCFLCFFIWERHLFLALLVAVCVIFEIEMLIHTRYILTSDGRLRIETGRFVRSSEIEVDKIIHIRRVCSRTFWAPALSSKRLEITFQRRLGGGTNTIQIAPRYPESFVGALLSKNVNIEAEI